MVNAPEIIFDKDKKLVLSSLSKENNLVGLCYQTENKETSILLRPCLVEKHYSREKRNPSQKIITQGKYECAAAALAMLIDEKLFFVKRALSKFEWRNDETGTTDEMLIQAARYLDIDLFKLEASEISNKTGPCILTLKSLNMAKMFHAVTWTGKEILDPNFYNQNRFSWGCEWSPDSLEFSSGLKLLSHKMSPSEREEYDILRKKKDNDQINKLKESIINQVNSLK